MLIYLPNATSQFDLSAECLRLFTDLSIRLWSLCGAVCGAVYDHIVAVSIRLQTLQHSHSVYEDSVLDDLLGV